MANTVMLNTALPVQFTWDMLLADALSTAQEQHPQSLRLAIALTQDTGHPYSPAGEVALQVSALRESVSADLVVGLALHTRDNDDGAYLIGDSSYIPITPRVEWSALPYVTCAITAQINVAGRALPLQVLSHELGHLMGLTHDRLTQEKHGDNARLNDYACGYIPEDKSFVTTMGYEWQGVGAYVPFYSTPDILYKNQPPGISAGKPGAADAAALLRVNAPVVAQYRSMRNPDLADGYILETGVFPALGEYIMPAVMGRLKPNTRVRLKAVPRQGYSFVCFRLGEEQILTDETWITMAGNLCIIAEFSVGNNLLAPPDTQAVPADSGTFTLSPQQSHYLPGTEITVKFTLSQPGTAFLGWELYGKSVWNSVLHANEALVCIQAGQAERLVARTARRDCLVTLTGMPAERGTVAWLDSDGLPVQTMDFFRYGALAGFPVRLVPAPEPGQTLDCWVVDNKVIQASELLDLDITRPALVDARFKSSELLVRVTTHIRPERPGCPAIINVIAADKKQCQTPGLWFIKNARVSVSLYWWDEKADKSRYSIEWQVINNEVSTTFSGEVLLLTLDADTLIHATLRPIAAE